jgi:3-phenylpropionate/cinnamic acid dioxygenase small subunit
LELWELEAREEIRDTLARYTQYGDTARFDEYAELFTEDGVLEMPGYAVREGRSEIKAALTNRQTTVRASMERALSRHFVANVMIDFVSESEAHVASYFLNLSSERLDHWGRYRDVLVRCSDGRWRFRRRTVRLDARMEGSWAPPAGHLAESPSP